MSDLDQDLKELFQRQRAEEAARTPSYHRVLARPRAARRRPWVPILALGAAAAVVATVIVSRQAPSRADLPFTIAVGDLRMPTDFLLEVHSVPTVGRSDDWFSSLPGLKGNPL